MRRINSQESSEKNARHQITDARISEITKKKLKIHTHIFIIEQNDENQNEEKILKATRGKKLCTEQ